MDELFLRLLNMSINASWICLAVCLFRFVFKKAPKWLTASLWALVGIRLLLPFSLQSALSLLPSRETVPTDIMYSQSPQIYSGISSFNYVVNPIISDAFTPEPSYSVNPLQVITAAASYIWVFGMVAMLVYMALSFIRIKRKVRESVPYENDMWETDKNIYLCDAIDTPFILGVIKPKIYLPSSVEESDISYVLSHEKAHIKRRDHLWKPLGFLLLTVYWFNPVLWLAYILLCRDIELACDERVMAEMGEDIKKPYSSALLNCSAPSRAVAACPLAFGETGVKSRIKSVLSYKKPAFWVVAVSVVISIVLGVCFLTDPSGVPILKADFEFTSLENIYNSESLEVTYNGKTRYYNDRSNINRYCATLEKIKVSESPVSKSRSENRSRELVIRINDSKDLIFEDGFQSVWIDNGVKPTYSFKVLNPETAEELVLDFKHASYDILSATVEGYYLTIAEEGVKYIEVQTPSSGGGASRADEKPFEKGDRVYLEQLNGLESLKGVTITAIGENEDVIYSLSFPEDEEAKEYNGKWKIEYSEGFSATDLDTAVSKAILDLNKNKFYPAECAAEGHIIMGTKESGSKVTAYVLEEYAEFGFENGWFIQQSGHQTACVMTFRKGSDVYTFIDAEYPEMGSGLAPSVKRMFPAAYEERAIDATDKDNEEMWAQCVAYAERYLKEIGREAEIGRYGDIEHTLFTDVGISVQVSNRLLSFKDGYMSSEIGTVERIEDGVRYVYRTSYHPDEDLILYTKEVYGTGKIVEEIKVNSLTGDIITENMEAKAKFNAKVLETEEDRVLVEALENEEIRKIGDRFWVYTSDDITKPDMYEGLYVTIVYSGVVETSDPGIITADEIYLYADVNYVGTSSPPVPTTFAAYEETEGDHIYSYTFFNDEGDSAYLSLTPSSKYYFFSLSLFSSTVPSGTYEDKDGYVTLLGEKDTKYVFRREGVNLVFQESMSSEVPKYKYSEDATEAKKCIPDGAVFDFTEMYLPYIDKAIIDVDGDGVYEECKLDYGPTSGLFTVVFTASAYGNVKYKNTFNSFYSTIRFAEKDGKTYVYGENSFENNKKEAWFEISVKDGNIVLQAGDEMFPYWGEQGTKEPMTEVLVSKEDLSSYKGEYVGDIPNSTVTKTVKGDYIIYGEENQNLFVHKENDYGSFDKPYKIGESVRLRHSGINNSFDKAEIYDYNLTFEQVLTDKEARKMLEEISTNFDEEKFLFEENDLYLVKVNIKYNPKSDIKEHLPVSTFVTAVNADGKSVSVEQRFNGKTYSFETENGEVSNWYPVFVPKGTDVKLAFAVGALMEYPGLVAAVCYSK